MYRIVILAFLSLSAAVFAPSSLFAQDSASDTTVTLKQLVLSTDVQNSEPVDSKTQFSMADRYAFCFVRYENYGMANTLRFRWFYNDALLLNYEAKTQSGKGLKTFSVVTLQPGNWKVDVIAPGGAVLKSVKFKVTS